MSEFCHLAAAVLLSAGATAIAEDAAPPQRPNILWITSEDNSPMLGCYGDELARTPNLDRLASEGVLYERAYANAPVSAPTRFTLLTGMYASSMGTQNMRSRYEVPSFVKPYTHYLRNAGYYCSNQSKTDYNFKTNDRSHWDASGRNAGYEHRGEGQPFFSVINFNSTHESSIHPPQPDDLITDPQKVTLPPYHPDTPEMRNDWALYYDRVAQLDAEVGKVLDKLEADGLADDTIVFYYSDHGGVLGRSKRFLYESGTHVPLIIRFPEKYAHLAPSEPGSRDKNLVSFVDFAPTLLSLAGIDAPEYMQGKAFLGLHRDAPRENVFLFKNRMDERFDFSRGVVNERYKYIRNFMPYLSNGQYLEYQWKAPSMKSWEMAYLNGECNEVQSRFWKERAAEELYDLHNDPHEVVNLASEPEYQDELQRMRNETYAWMKEIHDTGFVPEGEMIRRTENTTAFEFVRSDEFPYSLVMQIADRASREPEKHRDLLQENLANSESVVRYWAITACIIDKQLALRSEAILKALLNDPSPDVRVAAAEALYHCGSKESAITALMKELKGKNKLTALKAANALDEADVINHAILLELKAIKETSEDGYIVRTLTRLLDQAPKTLSVTE